MDFRVYLLLSFVEVSKRRSHVRRKMELSEQLPYWCDLYLLAKYLGQDRTLAFQMLHYFHLTWAL